MLTPVMLLETFIDHVLGIICLPAPRCTHGIGVCPPAERALWDLIKKVRHQQKKQKGSMIKVLSFEEVIPYLRMPTKGWPPYIDVIEFL